MAYTLYLVSSSSYATLLAAAFVAVCFNVRVGLGGHSTTEKVYLGVGIGMLLRIQRNTLVGSNRQSPWMISLIQ